MADERSGTVIGRTILRTQPDERLVALTREGHDSAYEEIVRRYRARLVRQAQAIVPMHRAEDVVQESLTRALTAMRASEARIALAAWLATIVRNRSLNDLRDEPGPHEELDSQYDGVPQPPAVAAERQEMRDVVAAIGALPEQQRRALVGRELEGKSHDAIAAELGVSADAARGLIFRARTGLRDALGALVPLPVVRFLLDAGSAEATGGAAAGAGVAAAGMSIGTKAAVGTLAVLATVGSGVAIERRLADTDGTRNAPDRAQAAERTDEPRESGGESSGPGGGQSGVADARQGESGDDGDNSGPGESSGPGGGDDGPDLDDNRSGEEGSGSSGPGTGGDDENSGPGGGESSGPGGGGEIELDDGDSSGPGGGGSSGSGGSDSSGSGSGDEPEDTLLEPIED